MDWLDHVTYGNSLRTWLLALVVAAATYAGLKALEWLVLKRVAQFTKGTKNRLDDLALGVLGHTRPWFLAVMALFAGSQLLLLPGKASSLVSLVAVLTLVAQAILWGNAAIGLFVEDYAARRLEHDAASATTVKFLGFLARLVLVVILLLVALDTLGVDITALVAGLGIGGIAIALAAQTILGDLFASLSIVLDKPFVIGDFIIVDTLMGTVEHIGLKTTRVRSLSGEQLVFANADLLKSRVRNYKRMFERRIVFGFGVTYDTPPETLRRIPELCRQLVEALPDTRFDRAHFAKFGPSSLDFEVVYYLLVPDYGVYMDRQQAINLGLVEGLAELQVEFAFPTQTLYVKPEPSEPPAQGR